MCSLRNSNRKFGYNFQQYLKALKREDQELPATPAQLQARVIPETKKPRLAMLRQKSKSLSHKKCK